MGILIRPWQKSDLPSIRRVTWKSWIATYSSFIPENDLRSYFDTHYTDASLLSMFDDPSGQGFIAETDDHIVGYLRLFVNRDENRLYIPSLHVLQDFQGQSIGRRLLDSAEEYAAGKRMDRLWIGVMVKNRRALVYYRKVGFQFVREEPFSMGNTTVRHLIGYKKLGRNAFLDQKTYTTFDGGESLKSLPGLCLELLSEQKKAWLDLQEGYESFKAIREREVLCRGFSVRLQYNPRRIKSSMADVGEKIVEFHKQSPCHPTSRPDGATSRPNGDAFIFPLARVGPAAAGRNERPCFLCLDNLYESQRGILHRNEYLILCNPMPVFSSHFTVSHIDHRLQAIDEHIGTFLQLMADFGSGWTVLYNGPKCGASAPDHLHFQVAPLGQMPIEREIRQEKRLSLVTQADGVLLYRVRDLGREVILLEGADPMSVEGAFKRYLNALKKVLFTPAAGDHACVPERTPVCRHGLYPLGSIDEEPMMNIAGFCEERKGEERKWRLVIFPRRKHRPDVFFREGDARVVVSPGVIDMGGVLVTPVEKDFDRLDAAVVESIYEEVSLEGKTVERVIDAMV
jgi:ribosomal protein S18 acetylase RimI-like enzyme